MTLDNWRSVILEDISYYGSDKIKVEEINVENYISTENMLPDKGGKVNASSLPSTKTVSKYEKGDTLISNIRPYFKKIWFATQDGGSSNDVLIIKNKYIEKTNSKYLYYYLSQNHFFDYVMGSAKGTKMPRGDKSAIMKYPINLPGIKEQKAIANILSSLDEKIEVNNTINKKLEEMAQAIFKQWFVDFEFPNDEGKPYKTSGGAMVESELGMIPEGWEVLNLSDFVESVSKSIDKKKKELAIFLNTSDVLDGDYLHANYKSVKDMPGQAKKLIEKDDILFSEIRPVNKRFAYVDFNADDYVVSTKLMVLRTNQDKFSSKCLYLFLTNKDTLKELQLAAESRSGTFPQITFKEISKYKFAIPNKEKFEPYYRTIDKIFDKKQILRKENKLLKEIRDTLLPKLMSGEIRVPLDKE